MNDLIYNEIVATPGYELEFAVGTTYSLDAEAFLAIALSFARLGDVSEADFRSPLRLLEGLRQANNRVAVFCNRGGLQPPVRVNPLYAMLDKSVFEVADERKGKELANFHPKIWVIKERSLDERTRRQLKLIVMSRNLTKDTSLDIAVSMTAPLGVISNSEISRKHQPLKELLLNLAEKANFEKRKKIRQLAKDIDSAGEFVLEAPYEDYEFLPIYFGDNLNPDIDFRRDLPGQKMMIVSPFIDKEPNRMAAGESNPVKWLNEYRPSCDKVLLTRLDSLTPEIMALYSGENREVWVMSEIAEQNDIQRMNLHAKMYFSWGTRNGGVNLWLGSSNATHNGFYRNTEFMLKLKLKRGRNQFEDFKAEFCNEKKQMCERITYLPETETRMEDDSLAISVRKSLISRNNLTAEVIAAASGYTVIVSAKRIKDICGKITIAPIQEPRNEVEIDRLSLQCHIEVGACSHLSELYILRVEPVETGITPVRMVIRIKTQGIPQDRDDSIFRSLIDTRDKFLDYIEMMITDRPQELAIMMMAAGETDAVGQMVSHPVRNNTVYESLLRIASTDPDRLEDVEDLVNRVGGDVVPESFVQMCDKFKQSIKKIR